MLVEFKGNQRFRNIRDWLGAFKNCEQGRGKPTPSVHSINMYKRFEYPYLWKKDNIQMSAANALPFLDMKTSWSYNENLIFVIVRKKGQKLKYVRKGSTHTPSTLHKIPFGVLDFLEKFTS